MANLACVGSHAINGVAELHSELSSKTFCTTSTPWPEKFGNKTNGVAATLDGAQQSEAGRPSRTPSVRL